MVLTSSDIGTNSEEVESNLANEFISAKRCNAVLLIDEADVFMERRSSVDLIRNSLVAGSVLSADETISQADHGQTGLLRALEFFDGILLLTTNRVGHFDDAFISRIHVQLYYPDFDDKDRAKVWKNFINKLERERKDYIRLHAETMEYIESSGDLKRARWNGREIRNGTSLSSSWNIPLFPQSGRHARVRSYLTRQ